jgi:hypothetical protein
MKACGKNILAWIGLFSIGASQLVCHAQQVPTDATSRTDSVLIELLTDYNDRRPGRPFLPILSDYAQRTGISTQDLGRVLVKIMRDSIGTADEGLLGVNACRTLATLCIEDAFDDLRDVAEHVRPGTTLSSTSLETALKVAGSRLIPFAREIRDSGRFPTYHRTLLYAELSRYLEEDAKSSNEPRAKERQERHAEIEGFLFESGEKERQPALMVEIDRKLCKAVKEYAVSVEREKFLEKMVAQGDDSEHGGGVASYELGTTDAMRAYAKKELEALRRVPKDKRTSVPQGKGLAATGE